MGGIDMSTRTGVLISSGSSFAPVGIFIEKILDIDL